MRAPVLLGDLHDQPQVRGDEARGQRAARRSCRTAPRPRAPPRGSSAGSAAARAGRRRWSSSRSGSARAAARRRLGRGRPPSMAAAGVVGSPATSASGSPARRRSGLGSAGFGGLGVLGFDRFQVRLPFSRRLGGRAAAGSDRRRRRAAAGDAVVLADEVAVLSMPLCIARPMPRPRTAIPQNCLAVRGRSRPPPLRSGSVRPVAPTPLVTTSAHGVQRAPRDVRFQGALLVMLGTSEDVVSVADEVVERDRGQDGGRRRRRCWPPSAKCRFWSRSCIAACRESTVRLELRQHAQERRPRPERRRPRVPVAVGGVGGPAAPPRQVVGGEPDLQLLPGQDLDPRRPGEAAVGLDADVVLAGEQRGRDERRDARGRRCRSTTRAPSGLGGDLDLPGLDARAEQLARRLLDGPDEVLDAALDQAEDPALDLARPRRCRGSG